MKICQVGAELFHAHTQTDMTKLTVAFRNFANAPKKAHHLVRFRILTTDAKLPVFLTGMMCK